MLDWFHTAALLSRRATSTFTPADLFAASEPGFWYDPSDFSTMFQDTAATTPVTATGQSVARINDKSGRGNHATQGTLASRPILQQDAGGRYYLAFDGSDDCLVSTSTVNFSTTDKVSVFAGVQKASDAATGLVVELTINVGSVNGAFALLAPSVNGANSYRFSARGTTTVDAGTGVFAAAPNTAVLTGLADIASPFVTLRRNGSEVTSTTTSLGTGNFANVSLFVGRRNNVSAPLNGRLYGLIARGAASTASQISSAEAWMNTKTGAY